MLDASIDYRGGYISGLLMANEVVSRYCFETYKSVSIFFSNGYPSDYGYSVQLARHIQQCYAKYDLRAFVVGFGAYYLDVLESFADNLGGTYQHTLTAAQLRTTFCSISASLKANAGLALGTRFHDIMCSICKKELACKPTVKLQPCMHDVHKAFQDLIAAQADCSANMRDPRVAVNCKAKHATFAEWMNLDGQQKQSVCACVHAWTFSKGIPHSFGCCMQMCLCLRLSMSPWISVAFRLCLLYIRFLFLFLRIDRHKGQRRQIHFSLFVIVAQDLVDLMGQQIR